MDIVQKHHQIKHEIKPGSSVALKNYWNRRRILITDNKVFQLSNISSTSEARKKWTSIELKTTLQFYALVSNWMTSEWYITCTCMQIVYYLLFCSEYILFINYIHSKLLIEFGTWKTKKWDINTHWKF